MNNRTKIILTIFNLVVLLARFGSLQAEQDTHNGALELLLRLQKRISQTAPQTSEQFNQAVESFQKGDIESALAKLENAMKQEARNPVLGPIYAAYRQIIAESKKFERSVNFFQNLVLENPKVADAHAYLGSAYGEHVGWMYASAKIEPGRVEKSSRLCLEEYELGLKLDENSFPARLGRGIYLTYVPGRFEEATKDFQKLFDMESSGKFPPYPFEIAYFFLGDAYKRNGHAEKAKETWQNGLKLYPNSSVLKKALSKL